MDDPITATCPHCHQTTIVHRRWPTVAADPGIGRYEFVGTDCGCDLTYDQQRSVSNPQPSAS